MKRVILIFAFVFFATVPSVTAKELPTENVISYRAVEVSTFCKLIREGNYEAVKAMIKNGENVNRKSGGLTPLMFAARYNKAKIAKLLIDNGAKLKVRSDRGFTALKWAKLSKAKKVEDLLKESMKK